MTLTQRHHQHLRRCQIRGKRNIVYVTHPQQGRNVRLVRLRGKHVAQKYHRSDISLGDLRADLQVAAFRAGQYAFDLKSQLLFEQLPRGSRSDQHLFSQRCRVNAGERHHVCLAAIMSNQRNGLHTRDSKKDLTVSRAGIAAMAPRAVVVNAAAALA